jgi:hypothetical protein
MRNEFNTYGTSEKYMQIFVRKPDGNKQLGNLKRMGRTILIFFNETGSKDVEYAYVTQETI